jgi:hypothetical protein
MIGLVLRYMCLGAFDSNFHGSVPQSWAQELPGFVECFASPFNHKFRTYYTMFEQDRDFGSSGNFFVMLERKGGILPPGRYEMNPPWMNAMYERLQEVIKQYDKELALSDIILGNMNVVLNRHSQYGRTKETGLPFAMIKAAKPGILPDNYPVPEEIISSTIRYESYDHLGKILTGLIKDRQAVTDLQKMALENSYFFSPGNIYKQITAGDRSGD